METFPRFWLFVTGIHRSPVDSPHKGQWRRALIFSLSCAWTNVWANNRNAGDLIRHQAHCDVTVMKPLLLKEKDLFIPHNQHDGYWWPCESSAVILQWNLHKATIFCRLSSQVVFHDRDDKHGFVKTVPGKLQNVYAFDKTFRVSLYRFHCTDLRTEYFGLGLVGLLKRFMQGFIYIYRNPWFINPVSMVCLGTPAKGLSARWYTHTYDCVRLNRHTNAYIGVHVSTCPRPLASFFLTQVTICN